MGHCPLALRSGSGSNEGVDEHKGTPTRLDVNDFWTELVERHHDLPALLRLITERVVSVLGDGCVLTTVSADGMSLTPSSISHTDPTVAAAMRAVLSTDEMRIGEGIAGTVAADRRPVIMNDLPPQQVAETTPARFMPFVRDHPMRALMIAPLIANGELLGTIGAVRTSSDAPYTPADLALLEALAERAALAIADALAGPRTIGAADFEAIYRYNLDGVLITTPDGHILAANPAACEILGRTEVEIIRSGREGVVVVDDPRLQLALAERAATGRSRAELFLSRGDGTTFPADVSSTIFTTPDQKVRTVIIFRDVSGEVAARESARAKVEELEHTVNRDALTGLLNRRGFALAASQALAAEDRSQSTAHVLFLDVDRLKGINDELGHRAGDAAIVAMASAIDRSIRDVDVACRLSGDEFVVLLVDTARPGADRVVERIRKELADDPDAPAGTGFTAGVMERPPLSETSLDELIDIADHDMYRHKVVKRLRGRASEE
jgi:diguanylate cyclase (GGDEF)-like protein/PAS domain S-box-containing protein